MACETRGNCRSKLRQANFVVLHMF
jgi:hypothetical protein